MMKAVTKRPATRLVVVLGLRLARLPSEPLLVCEEVAVSLDIPVEMVFMAHAKRP